MSKKQKLMSALLAASMLALTACGGGSTTSSAPSAAEPSSSAPAAEPEAEPSSPEAAADGKVIKLALGTDLIDWAQDCADQYQQANPGATVEITEILNTSDMYTKITMMMQNPQTCPDVISEDGFMINSDAAAGYLEPLDDLIASWDDVKNFNPTILDGGKAADGKQYGIPYSTDVQFIWYNKSLLEQVGVPVPFEPKSWNDILDAAKKLRDAGVEVPMFLYASKTTPEETSMRTFQVLMSGANGQLYDFDQQKWVVDKANLTKVFEFVNQVYNVEKVGPPLSIAAQQGVSDLFQSDYMKNGKLGLYFSGSWEAGNWGAGKKYDWPEGLDTWGVAKIPTSDGQSPGFTTMSGGWTWAIPANAQNKEGGKDFLKTLCNKDNSLAYALLSGNLAVRQDVMDDTAYSSQEMAVVNEAAASLEFTHFRPSVDGYSTITTMYTEVIESIAMGSATPEQALATFESELRRIAKEENVIVK